MTPLEQYNSENKKLKRMIYLFSVCFLVLLLIVILKLNGVIGELMFWILVNTTVGIYIWFLSKRVTLLNHVYENLKSFQMILVQTEMEKYTNSQSTFLLRTTEMKNFRKYKFFDNEAEMFYEVWLDLRDNSFAQIIRYKGQILELSKEEQVS
ncbi:hypothetical protein D5F11_008980 [Siminovitchia terrae]|uniref:Uncharacterized protein n=1 Tax=Siminovitchia terrae TaxID=1914933 RepID=A0A429X9U9_SIMTE|nr:hypothetical protein [Siminovitchia terrae]RST60180.1 hypothetical protein D5F11_008980 [Siminovitchia terrae]